MRVNLRWRPPSAAHSSPMAVSTIDRHIYNHMFRVVTLLLLHVLDHVEIDLPTSPGVLLHNLGKILLDGLKALQVAQKKA